MEVRFDEAKTRDEKLLDKLIDVLSESIPEQTTDTMDDYVRALNLLYKIKDPRFDGLIEKLKDLYTYPTRDTHNSFMKELHEYKEMIHEERIKKVVAQNKQLGESSKKGNTSLMKWLLLGAVIVVILKLSK